MVKKDSNLRILVVEDDSDALDLLIRMLETFGHRPSGAKSAKEALALLEKQEFDLAMLDIMMPEVNGYELLALMKENAKTAKIPVIMVTAKDQGSDMLEGYNHGADYYITKPYTTMQIKYGIKIVTDPDDEG